MSDRFDSKSRSWIMSRVKGKNTSPELTVRRELHRCGYRFRLHARDLPGIPDLILPRYRVAVFVHGCFWHRHGCPRAKIPKSNREYWCQKFERNRKRDDDVRSALNTLGWDVHVIWTCEINKGLTGLLELLTVKRQAVRSSKQCR